ncbi:hypothetical protein Tco_0657107 [Tanacetum coccineum]|uniref:Uncharacterized protein n=1 Tax=Tanacetum coccineum TaxID=301880 RepID=A0ABQ4XAM9_9ASTR
MVDDLVIDEDEVIPDDETPELIEEFQNVDKRVPTISYHERMESTIRDMLIWESKQEDLRRPKANALYGNTEEKRYVLSPHKFHAVSFPEEDLEEKMYGIDHKKVRDDLEEFFSDHKIVEIVRVNTKQQHGLDFMQQIIMIRENKKPNSFSEADFKYLNKNDIEDMYYLCLNKKVNYRENKLMNSLMTFIRSYVISERVHDFQLRIKSYQIKINLTTLTLIFPGELSKFCDATLEKVLNEVKLKICEIEFLKKAPLLGSLDLKIMKAYEQEIQKRLNHREQMKIWESFMNGKPIL